MRRADHAHAVDPDLKEQASVRLKRIEGQIRGIQRMVADERYCADILVQIHGGDVMWQKECLLNIALQRVPKNCDKIAWLDCDIVFGSNDWAEQASHALDSFLLRSRVEESRSAPDLVRSQRRRRTARRLLLSV